jgi:hypothetical protein
MKLKYFWIWIALSFLMIVGLFRWADASSISTPAITTIQNAGSSLPMRPILDFVDGGCSDDSANNRTKCTGGGGSGGTGGGLTVFSASSVTFSSTQYLAIGGGAAVSSTEATVEVQSPTAAQVSNLSVQLSAAPGMGNSIVFTWRDGGSSQTLTCTISGASTKTCTDNADSFNVAQGDEIDIEAVTTGSPSAVTVVIGSQFGTLSNLNPTFTISNASSTGTTQNTLTKLTGAPSTAVITATTDTGGAIGITTAGAGTTGTATITTAGEVSCVFDGATTAGDYVQISSTTAGNCHDTGAATYPTSGQVIGRVLSTNGSGGTYTLDLFPSEIKGGSGGGGGGVSVNAPYLTDGTNLYVFPGLKVTGQANGFSWQNQGGASDTIMSSNAVYLLGTNQSGDQVRFWETSSPSTPYTRTCVFIPVIANGSYQHVGCGWQVTTGANAGHIEEISLQNDGNMSIQQFNSYSSFNSRPVSVTWQGNAIPMGLVTCFQLQNDGTNLHWLYSYDCSNFTQLYQEAITSWFGTSPDQIGFTLDGNGTGTGYLNAMTVLAFQ